MVPLIAPLNLLSDVLGRDDLESDAVLTLDVKANTGSGGGVPVHHVADPYGRRARTHLTAFSIDKRSKEGSRSQSIPGASCNEQAIFIDVDATHGQRSEVRLEADVAGEVNLWECGPSHQAAVTHVGTSLESVVIVDGKGGHRCLTAGGTGGAGGAACVLGLEVRGGRS